MLYQHSLFEMDSDVASSAPLRQNTQLLKWVGNKQRVAHEIIQHFPQTFGTYYEPFLGSGAVLGTLAPPKAVASDALGPLMEIWQTLQNAPETLKRWYEERWHRCMPTNKIEGYEAIKQAFNANPNGADLVYLSRSCYGGVVRFRRDGFMSTPCGVHDPITPTAFAQRVDLWHQRTKGTVFLQSDFEAVMQEAKAGDLIYCDPPYVDTQSILYGAQAFSLRRLFQTIEACKQRGVYVALSIDGTKKTGRRKLSLPLPDGLFEREVIVHCGRSMLRRFQLSGQTLEHEEVTDRLLLTY